MILRTKRANELVDALRKGPRRVLISTVLMRYRLEEVTELAERGVLRIEGPYLVPVADEGEEA